MKLDRLISIAAAIFILIVLLQIALPQLRFNSLRSNQPAIESAAKGDRSWVIDFRATADLYDHEPS